MTFALHSLILTTYWRNLNFLGYAVHVGYYTTKMASLTLTTTT